MIGTDGTRKLAHRVSYELHTGKIPDGARVLHTCDNRRCVRPEHLFLGTDLDNTRDMLAKGRGNKARGEAVFGSKLREWEVNLIRSSTRVPNAILADNFNVHITTIQKIKKRTLWKHL